MGKNPIAVLIDGENLPASHIATIMQKARELGDPIARCVVGDFTGDRLKAWVSLAQEHALELVFQQSGGAGKNSADIALTIRAMDLLAENRFSRFLIVSSDCDFAPLALRLRRSGVPVYGMGVSTAGSAWRAACTQFFELVGKAPAKPNGSTNAKTAPAKKASRAPAKNDQPPAKQTWRAGDRAEVLALLEEFAPADGSRIKLSQLGQHIRKRSKALHNRLSNGKLRKNLAIDPSVDIRGEGAGIETRLKPAATAQRVEPSPYSAPAITISNPPASVMLTSVR